MLPAITVTKAIAYLLVAAAGSGSKLTSVPCDFGEIYQFENKECRIDLMNFGDEPIRISNINAMEAADSVDTHEFVIPPHGQKYIEMQIGGSSSLGYTKRYIQFQTSEAKDNQRYGEAKGMILSVLDDAKPTFDFGVVNLAGGQLPSKEIRLSSREVENFRATKILSQPDYLDVSVLPDHRTVRAQFKDNAPWGVHNTDLIKVAVNTPKQSQVWIAVKADIHGEVIPDSNPFALGLMRKGNRNEFSLRLRSNSGKDFKVGPIDVSRLNAKAKVLPCTPVVAGCKLVHLVVADEQKVAQVGGLVSIPFPEYGRTLSLYVWGMLLNKDTKVLDYNEEMSKQQAAVSDETGAKSSVQQAPLKGSIDLGRAIKKEVAKTEIEPPPGKGPLLKWSVANQELIYGFVIYRAASQSGPFVKINDAAIPVMSASHDASTYQWRDNNAVSGTHYWYSIGIINRNGTKEQLSGPQAVVAK